MPSFKLTYFDGRGRAEVARMVFAYAGQNYTDERLQKEDWLKLKPNTPFGALPIMTVDGVVLCQSHAIEKYLGKLFNCAGDTPLEEAQVDMVKGCLEDTGKVLFTAVGGKSDEEKAEAIKKFTNDTLVVNLKYFSKILDNNGGVYMVGKKLSIADIHFAVFTRFFEGFGVTFDWSSTPQLKALVERVEAEPKIAAWIEKRPKTSF